MTGFVYAIGNSERVKIGYSADPASRFVKIKSDSGHDCEIIGIIPATVEQEREAHSLLSEYRLHGEWFRREGAVAVFCDMLPAAPVRVRPILFGKEPACPLQTYRKDNGLTLEALAARFGVQKAAVWKWERHRPPADKVLDIEAETKISRHVLRPDVFGEAP